MQALKKFKSETRSEEASESPSLIVLVTRELCAALDSLHFGPPVTHVYHVYQYAQETHERYVHRWGQGTKKVFFVGMNPGPFGMAQTGVSSC